MSRHSSRSEPLGYQALIESCGLLVPPLRHVYRVTTRSVMERTISPDGTELTLMPRARVGQHRSLVDHLTFAIKREDLSLTTLAALFERKEALDAVQRWLANMPASTYARRAGYLATFLTGHSFAYKLPAGAPRVPLLNPADYIVDPTGGVDRQFGVLNNLLGTRDFSPLVRRTDKLESLLAEDLGEKVRSAIQVIEPELLQRAVDYLYLSETRSTYGIEDEIPDNQRQARFRQLLESAGGPQPLDEDQFVQWQNQIVSAMSAEASYRQTQNWLSRPGRLKNIASFIPPRPDDVPALMDGIAQLAARASDRAHPLPPLIVAACAAFGFVYVHPFYDGNGRLHRFLIHHILRQAGFTPAAVVLPVSARMLKRLADYAKILTSYSKPRTDLLAYKLDADSGNILVESHQPSWLYAYFDATAACEFLLECVKLCVEEDLQQELLYLHAFDRAKTELETWLDMRQSRLTTLIDVIVQGKGELSKRKRALFKELSDEQLERVVETVGQHFHDFIMLAPA